MDVKRRRIKEYLIEGDHVGRLGAHNGMHDPLCMGGIRSAKIHLCCSVHGRCKDCQDTPVLISG